MRVNTDGFKRESETVMKRIIIFITLILALIMCMASCDLLKSLDPQPEHTHEFGEWSTTENATCTKEGVKVRYCTCGEKQSEIVPKSSHNVVIDEALNPSCTTTGLTEGKHCSVCNEVLVAQTVIDELVHNYSNGACTRCGATLYVSDEDGTLNENGDYILFGEYPQTKVTDTTLSEALSAMASSYGWISYEYYISGSNTTDFMWYQDVTYGTERYRGVYFTSYRPSSTKVSSSEYYSDQDDNGYTLNTAATAYWFKWEPLLWTILTESDGEALLLCNSIIDSMEYYHNTSNRTENGETIYSNNYAESNIRTWLNATFYETAFNELQQGIILTTEVDNSAKSTNPYGNETYANNGTNIFACENTSDKIFLLSVEEVTNSNYGFDAYNTCDSVRCRKASDYAQCQGIDTHNYEESEYDGNGYWWLRSPHHYYNSYGIYEVSIGFDGDINDSSSNYVSRSDVGVVPALRIML